MNVNVQFRFRMSDISTNSAAETGSANQRMLHQQRQTRMIAHGGQMFTTLLKLPRGVLFAKHMLLSHSITLITAYQNYISVVLKL